MDHTRPPPADDLERALRNIDNAIREGERYERELAARHVEVVRLRGEQDRATGGVTLDDLRRRKADLEAQWLARETHVRVEAQREAMRKRAESLSAEVQMDETRLANKRNELAAVLAKL